MITFGAVLGKVSRLQLLLIGVFEIIFYALNEKILGHQLRVTDVGGSMVIHAFGAYFGLTIARVLRNDDVAEENPKDGSSYNSDLFSMIGMVFSRFYNVIGGNKGIRLAVHALFASCNAINQFKEFFPLVSVFGYSS